MPKLLLLLGLIWSVQLQATNATFPLTEQEQTWLKAHPAIKLEIRPDNAPLEFIDEQGRYSGIVADYIALIENKLGIRMEPAGERGTEGRPDKIPQQSPDLITIASTTPLRKKELNFTAPYLDIPIVIITRDDAPFAASLDALQGSHIAVVAGSVSHNFLTGNHPELELKTYPTFHHALKALHNSNVAAFVGNIASTTHVINQLNLNHLRIAAHTRYVLELKMGVRNDRPELFTLLNRAINSVSQEEKNSIQRKWITLHHEHGINPVAIVLPVVGIILFAGIIIAVMNGINSKLRREIEERKQAEKRLRHSEQALRNSQTITHIGNYQWTVANNQTVWSDELYRIVGRAPEEFTPDYDSYLSCIHPDDRDNFRTLTTRAMENTEPYSGEYRIQRPDGSVRHVNEKGRVYLDKSGKVAKLVGVIHDITESKLRDLELEEKQQSLQIILDNAPIGIWLQDCHGKLRFVNRAFCEAIGISEQQFLSVNHYSEIYPEEISARCMKSDQEAFENSGPQTSYEQLVFVDGKPHDLEILKVRLNNESGEACGLIGLSLDVTERKLAEEKLRKQAFCDELTGLPNRNYLMAQLEKSLALSRRHNHHCALIFFDLDNFKIINDTLGHHTGDQLLTEVGKRLSSIVRQEDTAARLGGDEFVIITTNLGSDPNQVAEQARHIAEKAQKTLSQPIQINEHLHHLTMSIGISLFPLADENSHDVLKFADTAMYRAKESGRDAIRFFQPSMQQAAEERFSMQGMMRQALANEEFELHYQPQYDGKGRIVGAESLLRWKQPKLGMISPARFIPLAEESGMITNIGIWVLREACEQLKRWQNAGLTIETLAINVSPRQFHQVDFVNQVRSIIRESDADPKHLELELTEGILVKNINEVSSKIEQLRAEGIRFAIDDFGTGYSSLRYLQQLPLDRLKIDQSFVRNIHANEANAHIVETIISMAHHLEMDLIAEGVEEKEELKFLHIRGVDKYQGYYFSKPLPAAEFSEKLQQHSSN